MMNQTGLQRSFPDQLSGSGHTFDTHRHPSIKDPILSKRVCFYKSGDPQFSALRMVINNRSFKTFDALLDSLSKKVPLPFGVRNITTPRGIHAIYTLDELEDGKSYICSDRRKVKPINMALAKKKLPPWYHVMPVSSRRQTVQQARRFQGGNIPKQEPLVVRTPKKLVVFRNGDPTVKQTVVLHKRNTPTFASILEYISDRMQFHVVKLHTPNGRRVDGLPGLILCSGTVVAAGREPFKAANYNAQKTPVPTNRTGLRRLKSLNRKKKLFPYHSKWRNFSPSSERYILNRIHDSIAESSSDQHLPSNLTTSVDIESSRMLESVAETEGDTCPGDGAEGQGCAPPSDDDIEKSFRVNQDGSMTVEMRVRLTIKEEETVHWTTTLTRSSVANQINGSCLPEPEGEQEICSAKSDPLDLQSPPSTVDSLINGKMNDNKDEDPPPLSNGAFCEGNNEEDTIKEQTVPPRRAPTPGHKTIRTTQGSVESVKSLTAEGIQEGVVGSYSYKEQTENGAVTEQYCVVKQSTARPVPKPRRLGSTDDNITDSRNISTFKSAEMTEIRQTDSSSEEITETVIHIYEQQTCQDNFLANICALDMSASGFAYSRPATSDTGQLSCNNDHEPELWRPPTASESKKMSTTSDLTLSSQKPGAIQGTNGQQQFSKSAGGENKAEKRDVSKSKRISAKPKVVNKRVRRLATPKKGQKGNSAVKNENRSKVKTFSSAAFIQGIYGNKSKSSKTTAKPKKKPTQKANGGIKTKSSPLSDDTVKCILKNPNITSPLTENSKETVSLETSRLNVSSTEVSQQSNEYVQSWLEKAHLNPTSYPSEESEKIEAVSLVQTENGRCTESGYNYEVIRGAEEKTVKQPCQSLKSEKLPESLLGTSVKMRIQCFEQKLSTTVEKTTVDQEEETAPGQTVANRQDRTNVSQNNTDKLKPLLNDISYQPNPLTQKTSTETHLNTVSMELPPAPPPAEITALSNTEYCSVDVYSAASSPLYRLSSGSSQLSDNHPSSTSPTSDKTISPTDQRMETTLVQSDFPSTLREEPLSRAPSVKRGPLVSNASLERKMSLRKASLQKYTSCADAPSDMTTSSSPTNTGTDALPNGFCSTGTHLPPIKAPKSNGTLSLKSSPSCYSSASTASITSRERMSSTSISSSETPTPNDITSIDLQPTKTQLSTKKEALSHQLIEKKVKLINSPSEKRKPQSNNKSSSELSSDSDKAILLNTGIREHATPTRDHSTERRKMLYTDKQQKRLSPYYQSLDMMSPPVRHKSNRQMLSRHLSSDNASEPEMRTKRKSSSHRKHHQRPQSVKSTTETDQTQSCQSDNNMVTKTSDRMGVDLHHGLDPGIVLNSDGESGADKEKTCAAADVEQTERCEQSINNSEAGEHHCSAEEHAEGEETGQSEAEEDTLPDYYVELNVKKERFTCSELSDEDTAGLLKCTKEPETQKSCKGLNGSDDGSTDNSGVELHTEIESKKVKFTSEESFSDAGEEKESNEEGEEPCGLPDHTEETEGGEGILEDENIHTKTDKPPTSATHFEVPIYEEVVEKVKHESEEIRTKSVAERISLLQKHVADGQRRKDIPGSPVSRQFSQQNIHMESDVLDSPSESPTSQSALCTRSAPQSSLSFSYDSSGVITAEPEGNRVRSIREMFLAKSTTDIPAHGRFPGPKASQLSDLRADTSASGGYQSQTSLELSSGEDGSPRKSITKGFVRRTIERLYGKKDVIANETLSDRPTSTTKQQKKEHSSVFSPFHSARCKAVSELSYFNSTNALDTLNEATRCIAFNAQVGPGERVSIDNGRWPLRENTLIRKSVSDPVSINKAFANSPQAEGACEDTAQNTPYSQLSSQHELEDNAKSVSIKCTYFSLPHGSESDVCHDDAATVCKSRGNGESITGAKDKSEDTKKHGERNGMLPTVRVADFKMMDNKVHPLTKVPADGEVVAVQPGKGQGVINRSIQEPDVLDILYTFCGQHCPIL